MARNIEFLITETKSPKATVNLDAIPQEIRDEVESMYKLQKTNPNGRFHVTFDTKQELLQWASMAARYCELRPADLGGPIRIRKSPTRKLADNVGEWKVTDVNVESDKATEAIKDGVKAVESAAKATEEPTAIKPRGSRKAAA